MTEYIKKSDVIAYLQRGLIPENYVENALIIAGLSQMKTVEAEPVRHAHWIDKGYSRFMCSECKCMENVPTCMGIPNIWEYCPNCGAKMDDYGRVDYTE